jgi:hypothetical protein
LGEFIFEFRVKKRKKNVNLSSCIYCRNRETDVNFGNGVPFDTRKNAAHVLPKLGMSTRGQFILVAMKNAQREIAHVGPTRLFHDV